MLNHAATTKVTATILAAGTVSDAVHYQGYEKGIAQMPALFTGIAITFQVSVDNITFVSLTDAAGAAVSVVVAPSKAFALPDALKGALWFKMVSGSAETPARNIMLSLKY